VAIGLALFALLTAAIVVIQHQFPGRSRALVIGMSVAFLSGIARFIFSLALSRAFEREADSLAVQQGAGSDLAGALDVLYGLRPGAARPMPLVWTSHGNPVERRARLLASSSHV
jgi:Zn-dependent protease with chaperone function